MPGDTAHASGNMESPGDKPTSQELPEAIVTAIQERVLSSHSLEFAQSPHQTWGREEEITGATPSAWVSQTSQRWAGRVT